MSLLQLPHTRGCLVCGRDNPHGLKLDLHVDDAGTVTCSFTPGIHHVGFEGIIHGGLLATVLDEAMVWAATWVGKRFCVCGELNVRFRQSAAVGEPLVAEASVESHRSRLIETRGTIRDAAGRPIADATGKYVPVPADRNRAFVETMVADPRTLATLEALRGGAS